MLKHVSSSSSAGNTFSSTPNAVYSNCNKFTKYDSKMDSISLNSSASSNDSSLNDSSEVTESTNRSWRSSSASLHSFESPKVVIKIYTRVLCQDVEYKTLSIYNHTTCKEIVKNILKKFRLHRDSNLFYLTLEAWIKQTGIPIRSVMTLDDDACPALLQSCYRQKDLKFTLLMRRGENIKVYRKCLKEPPVNILISDKTNVEELIKLVMDILSLPEPLNKYDLYEYSPACNVERKLSLRDFPLAIQMSWPNQDYNLFQIRSTPNHNSTMIMSSLINNSVDNFKKNLKTEFALNLLSPSIKTNPSGKVLYI